MVRYLNPHQGPPTLFSLRVANLAAQLIAHKANFDLFVFYKLLMKRMTREVPTTDKTKQLLSEMWKCVQWVAASHLVCHLGWRWPPAG
jgi:hypothetical protein